MSGAAEKFTSMWHEVSRKQFHWLSLPERRHSPRVYIVSPFPFWGGIGGLQSLTTVLSYRSFYLWAFPSGDRGHSTRENWGAPKHPDSTWKSMAGNLPCEVLPSASSFHVFWNLRHQGCSLMGSRERAFIPSFYVGLVVSVVIG